MWASSGLLALLLVGIFVWPTRYRYDRISSASYAGVIRTDRLSGKSQQFEPGTGWVSLQSAQHDRHVPSLEQDLPKEELAKVELQKCGGKDVTLVCELYNGSTWNISRIVVEVAFLKGSANEAKTRRVYAMRAALSPVKPLTDGFFSVLAAPKLWPGQQWGTRLIAAKGTKP